MKGWTVLELVLFQILRKNLEFSEQIVGTFAALYDGDEVSQRDIQRIKSSAKQLMELCEDSFT